MKIVVAISGASGALYAKTLLETLKATDHKISLIATENALKIAREEIDLDYRELGFPSHNLKDFKAPGASGSNPCDQMVIIPCSMGTLGRIAHGTSDNLILRTADVCLKEHKKLILVPRETPLSLIHIENMRLLTLSGAVILPAVPSFYSRPTTIQDLVNTVVARVLDHMGIENRLSPRYKE